MQVWAPKQRILLYDLGLLRTQLLEAACWENVEVGGPSRALVGTVGHSQPVRAPTSRAPRCPHKPSTKLWASPLLWWASCAGIAVLHSCCQALPGFFPFTYNIPCIHIHTRARMPFKNKCHQKGGKKSPAPGGRVASATPPPAPRVWMCAQVRPFPFAKFPPHVRNVGNYAWKALALQEALISSRAALWVDAGLELRAPLHTWVNASQAQPSTKKGKTTRARKALQVHSEGKDPATSLQHAQAMLLQLFAGRLLLAGVTCMVDTVRFCVGHSSLYYFKAQVERPAAEGRLVAPNALLDACHPCLPSLRAEGRLVAPECPA